jgi:cytochrome P450
LRVAAPFLRHDLGPWSPGGRGERLRRRYLKIVDKLIDDVLSDPGLAERIDILALMLRADLEHGDDINRKAIAEQLLTLLVAGHETTASSLAWTVERVSRHPGVLSRLTEEAEGDDNSYRLAVINEVLRVRPVIAFTGRTVVEEPFDLEGWRLPKRTRILVGIKAIHENDRFHREADRFDPDRYLGKKPDTYLWIPFGGGMRRCLGAAFAQFEMDIVLRTMLRRFELSPTGAEPERESFRGLAYAPSKGGLATLRRRSSPLVPAEPAGPEPSVVPGG